MSEWIKTAKVGDKVVCLGKISPTLYGEILPQKGQVYTIRDFFVGPDGNIGLFLVEIVNKPEDYFWGSHEAAFPPASFRPVQPRKSDISVFTRLLNTTPADLVEA